MVDTTASTMRSQANTAKVLEGNPTLMRLRELEVLERMTLASIEWGTAGLLADLLGGVEGFGDVYRGGSIATGADALARLVRLPSGLAGIIHGPTLARSASEGSTTTYPRLRFGLV